MKYVFLLLLSMGLHAQGIYSAIIVDLEGSVENQGRRLFVGNLITTKDSVVLEKKSSVKILEENGTIRVVTSSFRLKASTTNMRIKKMFESGESLRIWANNKKNEGVSRGNSIVQINLKTPRNTKLTESPKFLAWETNSQKENFQLSLRCYENDFAKGVSVKGLQYALGDKEIESGKKYYWQIGDEADNLAWFQVLKGDELQKLQEDFSFLREVMAQDTAGISYLLLRAQICLNYELNQDAMKLVRAVLAHDAENSTANRLIAKIYDALNLPDESANSLRLSMKYEN